MRRKLRYYNLADLPVSSSSYLLILDIERFFFYNLTLKTILIFYLLFSDINYEDVYFSDYSEESIISYF